MGAVYRARDASCDRTRQQDEALAEAHERRIGHRDLKPSFVVAKAEREN